MMFQELRAIIFFKYFGYKHFSRKTALIITKKKMGPMMGPRGTSKTKNVYFQEVDRRFFLFHNKKHLSSYLLITAYSIGVIKHIIAAVSMPISFHIHPVTLFITRFARFSPEEFTLVGSCSAEAVVTVGLSIVTHFRVQLVNVRRTVFRLACAIFRQVTFQIS